MQFVIYDQLGKIVYQTSINATSGANQLPITKQNVGSGLYFCKINSSQNVYKVLKLLVK